VRNIKILFLYCTTTPHCIRGSFSVHDIFADFVICQPEVQQLVTNYVI